MPDGSGGGPVTIFEKISDTAKQGAKAVGGQVGQQVKTFGQTAGSQIFGGQTKPAGGTQQGGFGKLPPLGGDMFGFEKPGAKGFGFGNKPVAAKPNPLQDPQYIAQKQQQDQEDAAKHQALLRELEALKGVYHEPIRKAGEGLIARQQEERQKTQTEEDRVKEQQRLQSEQQDNQLVVPQGKVTGPGSIAAKRAEQKRESKFGSG